MGGLWVGIAALIAGVVGYWLGRSGREDVRPMKKHDFTIRIKKSGTYISTTCPDEKGVDGDDDVEWRVKEAGNELPKNAEVFLRFDDSPLVPAEPSDGGSRKISAKVLKGLPVGKGYKYKVLYRVGSEEVELEDPKLIIEAP